MPGFVDVTGWTNEEVKRLGHADEPDVPEYSQPPRQKKRTVSVTVQELAALSFAAYRVSGNVLHKYTSYYDAATNQHHAVIPNKTVMLQALDWPELMNIVTDQDRVLAQQARDALLSAATFRLLKDQKMSDFMQAMTDLLAKDTCSEKDCGLMSFLPQVYEKHQQQEQKQVSFAELSTTSRYLGQLGNTVSVDFHMLDKRFLTQYNCWAVVGHDGEGNVVSFLSKHEELASSGHIQGRIKKLEHSSYHSGAQVTSLNYVKKL